MSQPKCAVCGRFATYDAYRAHWRCTTCDQPARPPKTLGECVEAHVQAMDLRDFLKKVRA